MIYFDRFYVISLLAYTRIEQVYVPLPLLNQMSSLEISHLNLLFLRLV